MINMEKAPTIDQLMGECYILQQKQNKIVLDIITNLVGQINQANKMLQDQAEKNPETGGKSPDKKHK
jgi:hypothetical protein